MLLLKSSRTTLRRSALLRGGSRSIHRDSDPPRSASLTPVSDAFRKENAVWFEYYKDADYIKRHYWMRYGELAAAREAQSDANWQTISPIIKELEAHKKSAEHGLDADEGDKKKRS